MLVPTKKNLYGEHRVTASSLSTMVDRTAEPSIIDVEHLGRMTLGDRQLEREVLEIFLRQTALMLGRIGASAPALAAVAAHTLLGSARGIGAWRLARAAEQLELAAAGQPGDATIVKAIQNLNVAAAEARAAIDVRLEQSAGR